MRKKTKAQKETEGTFRKDRDGGEVDFPAVSSVDEAGRPDWLIDPVAVEQWDILADLLANAGVLTEGDLNELAHYCNLHAAHVKLWRGGFTPNASETTQRRLLATEFGLTPASRSKPAKATGSTEKANRFDGLRAS